MAPPSERAEHEIQEAIILAGGLGTRLRSVVADRAKPMADVAERPFVEWLLLALSRAGLTRATLAIGHLADGVRRYFDAREALGIEVRFSEERERLGTGGAARLAAEGLDCERLLVLNGDSYVPLLLPALAAAHRDRTPAATVRLVHVDDAGRYGRVELDAAQPDGCGSVRAFHEKQPGAGAGLINAGVYLVERAALLDGLPAGPSSLEREWFPALVDAEALVGVAGPGPFLDIGTPEAYAAAAGQLRDELERLATLEATR